MLTNRLKPIIFLAFANDRADGTRYLRNLPEEARRLQGTMSRAEGDGLCELVVRQNATVGDILDVFRDGRYRDHIALFHFGGHANGYQLLLETGSGKTAAADAGGLAAFLGQQRGLEIVFLNGCSTNSQVQGLLDAGVSAVIATAQAIDDGVATEFAGHFYKGLAGGLSISQAFAEAEAAVQTARGGNSRHMYAADVQELLFDDRWPWELSTRPGAEAAGDWNLPDAANDPLFGLPPLPVFDLPDTPYRYLNWYRREDAALFFGRGREIRDLCERVTDPAGPPLILFYGQSGVGKSSLLAAGLRPRLESSHDIRYLRREQELGLLGTLQADLGEDIVAGWRSGESAERPLTIILDQVEERYTRPRPGDPTEFASLLAALQGLFSQREGRPLGKLILAFRKEWLAEIEKQIGEQKLPQSKVFLQRLDRAGIVEVVNGPARDERLHRQYGLIVAEDLPVIIADDLLADRGSSVAPTLQILLSKLWAEAKELNYEQPLYNEALYDELRLGLDDFLNEQLAALREKMPTVVDSGLALDLLAYHTTPLGTAEQRAQDELEETYRHQEAVLPPLVQHAQRLYLLIDPAANQPEQPPASRLAHDTLAPLVRARFDESDKAGQRARRILQSRAAEWGAGKQGAALDDADLAVVEQGIAGMRQWTAVEERLVSASLADRDRRQRRRRIWQVAGVIAIAVILITAGLALWQSQLARTREGEARAAERSAVANEIRALAGEEKAIVAEATAAANAILAIEREADAREAEAKADANAILARGREAEAIAAEAEAQRQAQTARQALSGRLASQAHGLADSYAAGESAEDNRALSLLLAAEAINTALRPGDPVPVAIDTRVREVLAILDAGAGQVLLAPEDGDGNLEPLIAFSPDGRWLVQIVDFRFGFLQDLAAADPLGDVIILNELDQWEIPIEVAAFLPRGATDEALGPTLVVGGEGTVLLADIIDGRVQPPKVRIQEAAGNAGRPLISADGRWFLAYGDANMAYLHDLTAADPAQPMMAVNLPVADLSRFAVSPDEQRLVAANTDVVYGVDMVDSNMAVTTVKLNDDLGAEDASEAISPDGRWLVRTFTDGSVRLWDLADLRASMTPARFRTFSRARAASFDRQGRRLVIGGWGTTRMWDLRTFNTGSPAPDIVIIDMTDGVNPPTFTAYAFDGSGEQLAAVTANGDIYTWVLSPEQLVFQACKAARRNLSPVEWREYLAGDVYQATCPEIPLTAQQALAQAGDLALREIDEEAGTAYALAVDLALRTEDAAANNAVCWQGSLDNFAEMVLPACERAVDLAAADPSATPNNIAAIRDSRGLGRALTGDYQGAIEDFEAYAAVLSLRASSNTLNRGKLRQREEWNAQLKQGINPFTPELLKGLRIEWIGF